MRKVRIPETGAPTLRLSASANPYFTNAYCFFRYDIGVVDGDELKWLVEKGEFKGNARVAPEEWVDASCDLSAYAGREVGLVVKLRYSAWTGRRTDLAFFDDCSVVVEQAPETSPPSVLGSERPPPLRLRRGGRGERSSSGPGHGRAGHPGQAKALYVLFSITAA